MGEAVDGPHRALPIFRKRFNDDRYTPSHDFAIHSLTVRLRFWCRSVALPKR